MGGKMSVLQTAIKETRRKRNKLTVALIILSVCGILLALLLVWRQFPFYQRPFTACDPNKVTGLVNNSFDFKLPDNINSARAAETRTSWLEHNYIFILTFTTDLAGWQGFRKSLPDQSAFGFEDLNHNSHDPRIEPYWGWPKWFKAKIRKGKYYFGYLYSKDQHLRIDTICIDLSDPEKVIVYIQGRGPYNESYGLD